MNVYKWNVWWNLVRPFSLRIFICTFISLDTQEKSRNVEHTFLGRIIWDNYKHMAPKGWINCNLSVLAESTESISGDAIPADMLDMKYFSKLLLWTFFLQMSHAFGRSLSDLSVYLYPFCSVYFDSFIPALMLTESNFTKRFHKMR